MSTAGALSPVFISGETLLSIVTHSSLMSHLQASLPHASSALHTPPRHAHPLSPSSSSLLLMPSFPSSPSPSPIFPYIGVKLVTHFPHNSTLGLPGVHGSYALFSSLTGQPLATVDGTALTLLRTASLSGLASRLLSRTTSETLVMVGSGSLAPHLIRSHLAARPSLRRVIIWNRTIHKAQKLAQELSLDQDPDLRNVEFEALDVDLGEIVRMGDVISCATNSEEPLVRGRDLREGAHLDLVGSFRPEMRECDEEAVRRGRVFVDCEAAVEEAGELAGVFGGRREGIGGNLVELITGERDGRRGEEEVTVFKSVGSGVVDILAAQLVYETYMKMNCK